MNGALRISAVASVQGKLSERIRLWGRVVIRRANNLMKGILSLNPESVKNVHTSDIVHSFREMKSSGVRYQCFLASSGPSASICSIVVFVEMVIERDTLSGFFRQVNDVAKKIIMRDRVVSSNVVIKRP
jgi:hypothetical protein